MRTGDEEAAYVLQRSWFASPPFGITCRSRILIFFLMIASAALRRVGIAVAFEANRRTSDLWRMGNM